MSTARMPAAGLGIGAAILAAWIAAEGFSADPIIPVRGDVPTIGHGATRYEDGTRVTLADPPITRERARELAINLLEQQYGACVRDSLGDTREHPAEVAQAAYFAGQYSCRGLRIDSTANGRGCGPYTDGARDTAPGCRFRGLPRDATRPSPPRRWTPQANTAGGPGEAPRCWQGHGPATTPAPASPTCPGDS